MIDAEKLLGGLLGNGLGSIMREESGSSILPGGPSLGMGLLGVAMAAFEHFSDQRQTAPGGQGYAPPRSQGSPVPPPAPGAPGVSTPPPAPGCMVPPPVPGAPEPSVAPPAPASVSEPMLLIRAMIASANADGVLDDSERMRILGQLEGVGLTEAEKDFLLGEFNAPWSIAQLASAVTTPTLAAQVYTVSLLAIDVDTPEERNHLESLRLALGLDTAAVQNIARRLGKQI